MSTETTPDPAPELPPRPTKEEVDLAIGIIAQTLPNSAYALRAEVQHLRAELEFEKSKNAGLRNHNERLREASGAVVLAEEKFWKQTGMPKGENMDELSEAVAKLRSLLNTLPPQPGRDANTTLRGDEPGVREAMQAARGGQPIALDLPDRPDGEEVEHALAAGLKLTGNWETADALARELLHLRHEAQTHPARPQVTAWELAMLADAIERTDLADNARSTMPYFERAYNVLGHAAAFLAEKGVQK